eukprot:Skav210332  [mRNA]  locus=scaffold4246:27489:31101:- [translate_table: standard]
MFACSLYVVVPYHEGSEDELVLQRCAACLCCVGAVSGSVPSFQTYAVQAHGHFECRGQVVIKHAPEIIVKETASVAMFSVSLVLPRGHHLARISRASARCAG